MEALTKEEEKQLQELEKNPEIKEYIKKEQEFKRNWLKEEEKILENLAAKKK